MESTFGWTQIARSDVSKAAALLKGDELGVRDEIGFLTLHQGFADRLFPGTSVLQTRLRYALFVPWQIEDLEQARSGGLPAEQRLKRAERNLVIRLKDAGQGVIGLRSERYEPAQPPSTIYWTALRLWGILNSSAPEAWPGRGEVLARIDGGGSWGDEQTAEGAAIRPDSTFFALPPRTDNWEGDAPLSLRLTTGERKYLTDRIASARRIAPGARGEESLLSRLAKSKERPASWFKAGFQAKLLRELADSADREALDAAIAASSLAHIGRAVYSALVEQMAKKDGRKTAGVYATALAEIFAEEKKRALACRLDEVEGLVGKLEPTFRAALASTLDWLKTPGGDAGALWKPYCDSEQRRKGTRARLPRTPHAETLRAAWISGGPPRAEPLNYRWHRIGALLDDLHGLHG